MEMKTRIREKFKTLFGAEGEVFASAGRINLIGEHTDYNGGYVFPGAIDRGIMAEVKLNGTQKVKAFSLDYDEYEKSGSKFCVVATNAATGRAEYFYPTEFRDGCDEIHASCALPLVSKPVLIGKDYYYDGGVVDSIPLQRAYDDGCEKCVVILTQDRHFTKKPIGHEKAVRKALHKYPLTAEAVIRRHEMYNRQREFVFNEEKAGNTLVIAPRSSLDFHTLDSEPMKIQHIYYLGYEQGIAKIDEVKEFLAK